MHQQDPSVPRPRLVRSLRAEPVVDPRVAAVLEVLEGRSAAEVAHGYAVDPMLLRRWVRAFVEAGTAQVTNTPDPRAADQRDRFLAAFAHELRTPLAIAQGWAEMLAEGDLDPGSARAVGRLGEALTRLSARTLDVELLAAASLGRLRLQPRPATIGALTTGLPGLTEVGGEGADLEIPVDHDLFPLVLRDLWAAAALPPTPRSLRLEVTPVGLWLDIRVLRDGDPIDTGVLQALFEPFDLNDDATGVTIGLYLARALTVAHGGTIGVEQEDDGAVFWIRVPRRAPDAPHD